MNLYINWKYKNFLDILSLKINPEDFIKIKAKLDAKNYRKAMKFEFLKEDEIYELYKDKPILVSHELALSIIDKRKPLGLFYEKADDVYIGIDNLSSDAWVEEFDNKRACLKWLNGADVEDCL